MLGPDVQHYTSLQSLKKPELWWPGAKKVLSWNIYRGIKIFILGFLLNIGLNFSLLLKIKFEGWQIDPLEYIFGVDIFYLAGLSIIISFCIKVYKKRAASNCCFPYFSGQRVNRICQRSAVYN